MVSSTGYREISALVPEEPLPPPSLLTLVFTELLFALHFLLLFSQCSGFDLFSNIFLQRHHHQLCPAVGPLESQLKATASGMVQPLVSSHRGHHCSPAPALSCTPCKRSTGNHYFFNARFAIKCSKLKGPT